MSMSDPFIRNQRKVNIHKMIDPKLLLHVPLLVGNRKYDFELRQVTSNLLAFEAKRFHFQRIQANEENSRGKKKEQVADL